MYFSFFAAILVIFSSLFSLAAAAPAAQSESDGGSDTYVSKCNGGTVSCCNQTQYSGQFTDGFKQLLAQFGVTDFSGLTGLVGADCSAVNVASIGSPSSCSQQQVCCDRSENEGLVVVNCSPVNVSL